jgi:hypothetical protein
MGGLVIGEGNEVNAVKNVFLSFVAMVMENNLPIQE